MADVFLCDLLENGVAVRRVALKRLHSHLLDDAAMTGMLVDEMHLGLLCTHPNLVATLDSGYDDGYPYIVMEHVDGLDLVQARNAMVAAGRRFSRAQAVFIAMEICKGLAHLHELTDKAGTPLAVVHRDVTPPNVLLGVDGSVKLCDFGFVRSRMQRTKTDPGLIKGKFSYLAPELTMEQPIDHRADLFAVGIMLWEMLSMRRLFHGKTDFDTFKLVQQASIPSLASTDADIDSVLDEIVARMLAKDPSARYQTASALYNALAAYADWQELEYDSGKLVRELTAPSAASAPGATKSASASAYAG